MSFSNVLPLPLLSCCENSGDLLLSVNRQAVVSLKRQSLLRMRKRQQKARPLCRFCSGFSQEYKQIIDLWNSFYYLPVDRMVYSTGTRHIGVAAIPDNQNGKPVVVICHDLKKSIIGQINLLYFVEMIFLKCFRSTK